MRLRFSGSLLLFICVCAILQIGSTKIAERKLPYQQPVNLNMERIQFQSEIIKKTSEQGNSSLLAIFALFSMLLIMRVFFSSQTPSQIKQKQSTFPLLDLTQVYPRSKFTIFIIGLFLVVPVPSNCACFTGSQYWNGFMCLSCSFYNTGCQSCTTNPNGSFLACSSCYSNMGYYMSASLCSNCLSGCSVCTNGTICITCGSSYYKASNTSCPPCSTYCSSCTSNPGCTTCNYNAAKNTTNSSNIYCVLCSTIVANCDTCNITNCLTCIGGYSLSGGACIACNITYAGNCTYCSTSACQSCPNNTVTYNNSGCYLCNAFLPNCQTCSSSSYCLTCVNNSYIPASNGTCVLCNTSLTACLTCLNSSYCSSCVNNSYVVDSSTNQCVNCSSKISNCKTCSSASVCTSCIDTSYFVNSASASASTCSPCSTSLPNCKNCSSSTACTACSNNTYVSDNSTGFVCVLCSTKISNCNNCSSTTVCLQCINKTYGINSSSGCSLCSSLMPSCSTCDSSSVCLTCTNNSYAVDTSNHCTLCSTLLTACTTCSNRTACLTCVNDTYATGSATSYICKLCSTLLTNCVRCYNPGSCKTCVNNTYATDISTGFQCVLCSTLAVGCVTCSNSSVCLSCSNNTMALDTATNQCTYCYTVLSNCKECSSTTVCTTCYDGAYLNSSHACPSCATYCTTCVNATYCLTCVANKSVMNNDFCVGCGTLITNCLICEIDNSSIAPNYAYNCLECKPTYTYSPSGSSCQLCSNYMQGCYECTNYTNCISCPLPSLYLNTTDMSCVPCSEKYTKCTTCDQNSCLTCDDKFYLNFQKKCVCTIGTLISGYCVSTYGCTQAQLTNAGVVCTGCSAEFYLFNHACLCAPGSWLVSNICTNIYGCTAVAIINQANTCTRCNSYLNFQISNGTCICMTGFSRIGNVCVDICGDGKVYKSQCDDGNLIDGDGCSSNCTIEKNFNCTSYYTVKPSKCLYNGSLSISLVSISKANGIDQGVFVFKIQPSILPLSMMNFMNFVHFSCPSSEYQMSYASYSKGILKVGIDYFQKMEEYDTSIQLFLDPNLFQIPSISLNFTSIGQNFALVVTKDKPVISSLYILFQVLCAINLIILVVGSQFHKMIGVQTVHTHQIIFFLIILTDGYTVMINTLASLRCSNLCNPFIEGTFSTNFSRLGLYTQYIYNNFILGFLQLVLMVVLLVMSLISRYHQYKLQEETKLLQMIQEIRDFQQIQYQEPILQPRKKTIFKLQRAFRFFYAIFFYPFMIGFVFQTVFTLYLFKNSSQVKDFSNYSVYTNMIMAVLAFIGISIAFHTQIINLFHKHADLMYVYLRGADKTYVGFYTLFIYIQIMLLLVGYTFIKHYALFIVSGWILFELVVVIIWKPYKFILHNVGIIVNRLTVALFAAGLIYKYFDNSYQNSNFDKIYLILITVLLVLINAIAIVRVIYQIRVTCKKNKRKHQIEQVNRKHKVEINERNAQQQLLQVQRITKKVGNALGLMNPYRCEVQRMQRIHDDFRENNVVRAQGGLIPITYDQDIYKFVKKTPYRKELRKMEPQAHSEIKVEEIENTDEQPSSPVKKINLKEIKEKLSKSYKESLQRKQNQQ